MFRYSKLSNFRIFTLLRPPPGHHVTKSVNQRQVGYTQYTSMDILEFRLWAFDVCRRSLGSPMQTVNVRLQLWPVFS